MTTEPETARFHTLVAHFRAARCCGQHALYYAIRIIEREGGRPWDDRPVCSQPSECSARAKAVWDGRPKRLPKPSGEVAPPTCAVVTVEPCKGKVGDTTSAGGTSRGRSASPGSVALEASVGA